MSEDLEARMRDAVSLGQSGKLSDAAQMLRKILEVDPNLPQAHHNLAVTLAEQGRPSEAIESFEAALRLNPSYFEARLNLANTLSISRRGAEAVMEYRQALALRPDSSDALNGLGLTLSDLKRWSEATVYLKQAIRLRPTFAEACNSLGLALVELGQYAAAEEAYDNALRLNPTYVEAHTNLATCFGMQGRMAEAFAAFDLALWIKPDSVSTRWNRSLALLQTGQLEEGFKEYEWRWRRAKSPMRPMPKPLWDGKADLSGKTILIWCEQGLGDAIQFVRYAPMLKERGATVVLECPTPLLRILPTCPGIDRVALEGQLPEFDFHVPLMSLPHRFGTTLATIPNRVPYLTAPADLVEQWREKLSGVEGLKVGIAWQGNPHHQWDRHRSVPLSFFKPLAEISGVRLYSLQRGPGTEQLNAGGGIGFSVNEPLTAGLGVADSWAEIAAVIENLDIVVTVDTATAHLATALGALTCVVISAISDWRWMLGTSDSPWYPSLRLFRQRSGESTKAVFEKIRRALLLNPHRSARKPSATAL